MFWIYATQISTCHPAIHNKVQNQNNHYTRFYRCSDHMWNNSTVLLRSVNCTLTSLTGVNSDLIQLNITTFQVESTTRNDPFTQVENDKSLRSSPFTNQLRMLSGTQELTMRNIQRSLASAGNPPSHNKKISREFCLLNLDYNISVVNR
jgi:hypothetical protein